MLVCSAVAPVMKGEACANASSGRTKQAIAARLKLNRTNLSRAIRVTPLNDFRQAP